MNATNSIYKDGGLLLKLKPMIKVVHIYKEGNIVADHLANETILLKIEKMLLSVEDLLQEAKGVLKPEKLGFPYLKLGIVVKRVNYNHQ